MSGSTNRRRGHGFERDFASWLRSNGVPAITSRDAHAGAQYGPDLICDLPLNVELKNVAKWDLSGWLAQARRDGPAAVIVKRRGVADPGRSYAVMQADEWLHLIRPDLTF
jgi:hypothetical protein